MDTVLRAALLFVALLSQAAPSGADERVFCVAPPHDRLCPVFPQDQTDFSRFFEYRVVDAAAQAPFDAYAWQAFVALNWGELTGAEGAAEDGWRILARPGPRKGAPISSCARTEPGAVRAALAQSDGNTLIDQAGNFIVYETRLNATAERYIRENGLDAPEGRARFQGEIAFPQGVDAASPASVLVKTAWRVLPQADPGYIEATGVIEVPAQASMSGQPLCLQARLGLIGMHIVSKVASGHGDKWIWATIEHRANAPTSRNAREINSLYAPELFPTGCEGPAARLETAFTLFNSDCPDCATLVPPPSGARWAAAPPFARAPDGTPLPASQVVRCWRVFGPTQATNLAWQARLQGTPLANYMVVSAQWRGANPDPIFTHGELPRYLSNTAMETYVQTDPSGSCLGCHAGATTAEGAPSDFTFLLRN